MMRLQTTMIAAPLLVSLLFAGACALEGGQDQDEAAPDSVDTEAVDEELAVSEVLFSEALSDTATLEIRRHEDGSLETVLAGSSESDTELLQALGGLGDTAPASIIEALTGSAAPRLVLDAQESAQRALALSDTEPEKPEPHSTENLGIAFLDAPQLEQKAFSGGSDRFYDMFCTGTDPDPFPGTYPENSSVNYNRRCSSLLDRHPSPYMSMSERSFGHVLSAAAENHPIRFRAYYWGCKFLSCAWRTVTDEKVDPGGWIYSSWLGSTKWENRRVRVDAWNDGEEGIAVAHVGMTYFEECFQWTDPRCLVRP